MAIEIVYRGKCDCCGKQQLTVGQSIEATAAMMSSSGWQKGRRQTLDMAEEAWLCRDCKIDMQQGGRKGKTIARWFIPDPTPPP